MDFNSYLRTAQGATIVDGHVAHFGEPWSELASATTSSCKTPLTDLGVIGISGPDARDFIHGQFTSDCRELDDEHGQLSAWCSPKGRVLFLFRVIASRDGFELIIPRSEITRLTQRLSMYVLRAQVAIRDLSASRVVVGISIPEDAEWDPGIGPLPVDALQVVKTDPGLTIVRLEQTRRRYLVVSGDNEAQGFWQDCPLTPVGKEAWMLLDIYAGLPAIVEATSDRFLPQSLNLDRLGAVSFRKGCYPGQEVVTRLQSRGMVKQRMLIARSAALPPPAAGTPVFRRHDHSGNTAGHILTSARETAQHSAMLAIVDLSIVEDGEIRLADPDGAKLALTYPPYSFE